MEEWRSVVGFEGFYEVSNKGRLRSVDRFSRCSRGDKLRLWKGRVLETNTLGGRGYIYVSLSARGKISKLSLHRLVAKAFVPNPLDKPEVNHRDGNKLNNHVYNLEWLTESEHATYSYHVEGKLTPRKLTESDAAKIRALLARGVKQDAIAEEFSISQSNVSMINTGRIWND